MLFRSCYGDALLCALACGCYDSLAALGEKIRITQTVRPIPENHAIYKKGKPVFRALYESTKDLMHQTL